MVHAIFQLNHLIINILQHHFALIGIFKIRKGPAKHQTLTKTTRMSHAIAVTGIRAL